MFTKQIQINQQNYRLEIGPHQSQPCWKCRFTKKIALISYHEIAYNAYLEARPFCWPCALTNVHELEESDYQVPNKKEVVRELRQALNS
jgi:hypothetical protein